MISLGIHIIFVFINSSAILLNLIDTGWYPFIHKRITADIFDPVITGTDLWNNLYSYARDFWYLLLIFIILFALTWKVSEIFYFSGLRSKAIKSRKSISISLTILIVILSIIGIRGGLQYKPLKIIDAGHSVPATLTNLVLNTPFTVIRTWNNDPLTEVDYFPSGIADLYFPGQHDFSEKGNFRELNVVVIVLESFSKEYIAALSGGVAYTPFLDSLISVSYTCTNAYANGKRSIDGIPAIVASVPALMTAPYITSAYSGNLLSSLPILLSKKNYYSSFFHGGKTGTMNFDGFARVAGFSNYYGFEDYPDEKDYDGYL
jgi:uncharacterized membrane protein YhaH (DUF805 family)